MNLLLLPHHYHQLVLFQRFLPQLLHRLHLHILERLQHLRDYLEVDLQEVYFLLLLH